VTTPSPEGFDLEPTELVAGDLQLMVWAPRNAPAVIAALNDPDILIWNPLRLPDSPAGESDDEFASRWIAQRATWDNHATWAVCDAVSGDAIGYVSLHQLNPNQLSGEVGYWVLESARGQGVASAAVRTVARYGFDALGLHRIELLHAVDNPASCRVATSAGFRPEGVARQAYRYGDGTFHDDHMHARLATDPDPPALG
jgi:RimJ/RimL family protein N-acetyltransferase